MKKQIFGITALLAIVAFGLMFTACPQVQDDEERVVRFYNTCEAKIEITCQGSSPDVVVLEKAESANKEYGPIEVRRKGKDIEITSIEVVSPTIPSAEDITDYIRIRGSATPGKIKGTIKAGTIRFESVPQNGILQYKVDAIPLDE
jgi:hypothetical protein